MLQFETDKNCLDFHGQNHATLNHDQKLLSSFFPLFFPGFLFLRYWWISRLKALLGVKFSPCPSILTLLGGAMGEVVPRLVPSPFWTRSLNGHFKPWNIHNI
jgi:hypothetical protein